MITYKRILMKTSIARTFLVIATVCGSLSTAHAETDPCPILFGQGWTLQPGGGACNKRTFGNRVEQKTGLSELIATQQLVLLTQILASQQQLTAGLKELTDATRQLSAASESLKTSNVQWRQETLSTAIAEINKIPAAMAENQHLLNALSASLADRLAQDPAFRQRLKGE